jgi:hypothetical protein
VTVVADFSIFNTQKVVFRFADMLLVFRWNFKCGSKLILICHNVKGVAMLVYSILDTKKNSVALSPQANYTD